MKEEEKEKKKLDKKTRRILIIIALLLFFSGVLIISTVIASSQIKKPEPQKRTKEPPRPEETIVCTLDEIRDDVEQTEEVYLQNGVLITRTETSVWTKTEPREVTCKYYTKKAEGLNTKPGVTSNTTCDEKSGRNRTVYTISQLDRDDIKLKQFDYLEEGDIFDKEGWLLYMKENGYTCEEY